MDAAPSYFTQKPVDPPQPLTSPKEKEEYISDWPLKSLRNWFSNAPKNRKDKAPSPRTSHTSTSSSNPLPVDYSPSLSTNSVWVGPTGLLYRADADGSERLDAPEAPVRRDTAKGISFFEFDTPEHLPSSPMCPANPMHRLKGKGVCVVSHSMTPPIEKLD